MQAEIGARGRIRTRTGDALDVVSLLVGLHEQKEMEPPAGAAPARFLYKRNPQAAARRRKWPVKPKLGERRLVAVPSAALGTAGV